MRGRVIRRQERGPADPRGAAAGLAKLAAIRSERKLLPATLYRRSSYTVTPAGVDAVRQAVGEYSDYVADREPGTVLYLVVEPAGSRGEFVHLAAFRDGAALSASQSSAAYQKFVEALRPVLVGGVRVEAIEGPPVADAGSRLISRSDVSVQVKLTVRKRSDLEEFKKLTVEFTHRQEDGLLCSDAFFAPNNDLVFYIYERWSSQAALDAAMGSELQMALLALANLEESTPFSLT
ncbi:MAG: putative quinol monooxygenase [Thermoanaerobaculia bacterium]